MKSRKVEDNPQVQNSLQIASCTFQKYKIEEADTENLGLFFVKIKYFKFNISFHA